MKTSLYGITVEPTIIGVGVGTVVAFGVGIMVGISVGTTVGVEVGTVVGTGRMDTIGGNEVHPVATIIPMRSVIVIRCMDFIDMIL